MLYRALKSFVGLESMRRGEVKDITDADIIKDLLKAGYIEAVEDKKPATSKPSKAKSRTEV